MICPWGLHRSSLTSGTRGFVDTGTNVLIGGFIIGGGATGDLIVLRGIGPSLAGVGLSPVLANPRLELHDSSGALVTSNDNWQDDPTQAALITALGLAPTDNMESAIASTLAPGAYTTVLAGVDNGTGLGLVEVYDNPIPTSETPTPTPVGSVTPSPTPGGSVTPTPTPAATATPTPGGVCMENFDSVTAPALPGGWSATNPDPGDGTLFVTVPTVSDTAPNSAFIPDQDGISDKTLVSRPITITSNSPVVTFRNNFNSEFSDGVYWDGGVLEISSPNISSGDFLDVTDSHVGGTITSGGYTGEISGDASNPLSGRMAWSGNSNGFIETTVNLGPNVVAQTIYLRFRFGSDEAVAAPGWWIDTFSIDGGICQ